MEGNFSKAVHAHWKRFIWIWAFPLFFFLSILLPSFSRNPMLFFFAIDLPILLACIFVASKPVRDRRVTVAQGLLLIVGVPFAVWVVLLLALFGLAGLINQIDV